MIILSPVEEQKRPRPRYRPEIFYDILCSIIKQEASVRIAGITRVQNEVNLPSDRFRAHLEDMETLGLIEYGEGLTSTEKGRDFVSEYEKVAEVLRRFGLD
jgi:predicted transcriptional regulator